MISRVVTFSLIMVMSTSLSSFADDGGSLQQIHNLHSAGSDSDRNEPAAEFLIARQVESITDKLYSNPSGEFSRFDVSRDTDTQSCDTDDTALITVYSANGMAQSEIDVKIDGSSIGSLTSYYPDEAPACKTPSARGIITLELPAGTHTLEAVSPNLSWPSHHFTVKKCECMLLPLT